MQTIKDLLLITKSSELVAITSLPEDTVMTLSAHLGQFTAGMHGVAGIVQLNDAGGIRTVFIDGSTGNLTLGGQGHDGDLIVNDSSGAQTVRIDGGTGNLVLGGNGQDGDIVANNASGNKTVHVNGSTGNIAIGGSGEDGDLIVNNSSGEETVRVDGSSANLTLGGNGQDGDVVVLDSEGNERIRLDGNTGDIRLKSADVAEQFDSEGGVAIEPGMVVSLRDEYTVGLSSMSYDNRVVGVVAGAGSYQPGVVMDYRPSQGRVPVGLLGKVYCRVDTSGGKIEVGDLLTTSEIPGHAMRVTDTTRGIGAILGKALRPVECGTEMIPILLGLN